MSGKWTVREIYSPFAKPGGPEPALLGGNPFSFRPGEELERDDDKTVSQEKDGVIIRQWFLLKLGPREGFVPHNPLDPNDIRSPAIPFEEGMEKPFSFNLFEEEISRETFARNCVRKAIRWRSNAAFLYALAFIESGANWPDGKVSCPSPADGELAVGTFGFLPATWRTLVDKLGKDQNIEPADIRYPEAQTTFAAAQTGDSIVELEKLLADKPTYVDLYLAHLITNAGCATIRKAEKDQPGKTVDVILEDIFSSLDDDTRKTRIDALFTRNASLLKKDGNPVTVTELIANCVSDLNSGFDQVKQAAAAMIPDVPDNSDQVANGDKAGPDTLGVLSEEFESNGNPAAIGFDSTGGWSYGKYQIASKKGRFAEFLGSLDPDFLDLKTKLENKGGDAAARQGTEAFKNLWRSLKKDPNFVPAQHAYIKATHYDKMVAALKSIVDVGTLSNAMQNVVWSVSVQHGPASSIVKIALNDVGHADEAALINRIYNERSKVDRYFASSKASIKAAVLDRFRRERAVALQMLALERA
ncbi:hypothetical protein [Oricola sp.]|uniref:VgrG-related protein n=1 Tax=Oricola sp. TaxID=1979950 RepID=UPI003514FB6B